jgi:hypothetical protein
MTKGAAKVTKDSSIDSWKSLSESLIAEQLLRRQRKHSSDDHSENAK